jgi:hypothetical protein
MKNMKNLSLRDFQQKGQLSVGRNITEPILLTGRSGPLFFLIPADVSNLENQYQELLRAMGQANLINWQNRALELGLDKMSLEDINKEILDHRNKKKSNTK